MKFPNEAFDYINKRYTIKRIIKYALNWKNSRQLTNLTQWMERQVLEAGVDSRVIETVKKAIPKHVKENDYDMRATLCLRWVIKHFKYVTDERQWKTPEYWQSYDDSLQLMTGDCEDGAILLYVLCRVSGIPANRLSILCGDVLGGGHAWLSYRPEALPWVFTFLDWCYWANEKPINTRPHFLIQGTKILGRDPRYYKIWFGFNELDGYYYYKL